MTATNKIASNEIFAIAQQYGLVDVYADAPGSRIGEYVGTVDGRAVSCVVYDRDPAADLRALRLAVGLPEAHPIPRQQDLFENVQAISVMEHFDAA